MRLLRKGTDARGNREGAAMVEFAITLPLLALVMFGIIEAGSAWHREQVLATASREGARVGAIWSTVITEDSVRAAVDRMIIGGGLNPNTDSVEVHNLNLTRSVGSDTVVVIDTLRFPVLHRLTVGLMPAKRVLRSMTVMHNE